MDGENRSGSSTSRRFSLRYLGVRRGRENLEKMFEGVRVVEGFNRMKGLNLTSE